MSETWLTTFKNLALPQFCQCCDRRLLTSDNGYFCPTCWGLARRVERPFCTICGTPHMGSAGFGEIRNFPCSECRNTKHVSSLRRTYVAAYYEGAIADSIKLLKFKGKHRLATPLGEIMAEFARMEMRLADYDDIVPVPLHRVRGRERGFNQSTLLSAEIASQCPNATVNQSLRRIRPTRIQKNIKSHNERRENVVGAFAVERGSDFDGRTVLLVDDVLTSGGTVSECARALRRAGAANVDAFVLALAVKKTELAFVPN